MVRLGSLAQDVELEREGRWVEFVPGLRFRVAAADNARARELFAAKVRAARDEQKGRGRVPQERLDRIADEVTAEAVLVGWEGLDDDAGLPIPWSQGEALRILTDEKFRKVRQFIQEAAADAAAYRAAAREDVLGN